MNTRLHNPVHCRSRPEEAQSPKKARRAAKELGAAPMNPLSPRRGEGQGEGLAVAIQLHEKGETVTLTPALSHPMGEGHPPGLAKNTVAGRGEDAVHWQAQISIECQRIRASSRRLLQSKHK